MCYVIGVALLMFELSFSVTPPYFFGCLLKCPRPRQHRHLDFDAGNSAAEKLGTPSIFRESMILQYVNQKL